MLLVNISPIYLRCGAVITNSESLEKELDFYKDKFIYIKPEQSIDYKLNIVLNEKSINPEQMKSEILKLEEKKNPYIFEFPYENEWWIDYVTNPDKAGLLYKNEEGKNRGKRKFW